MIALVWLIPAFPLAAFLIAGLFGRRCSATDRGHRIGGRRPLRAASIGVFSSPRRKQQTVVQSIAGSASATSR